MQYRQQQYHIRVKQDAEVICRSYRQLLNHQNHQRNTVVLGHVFKHTKFVASAAARMLNLQSHARRLSMRLILSPSIKHINWVYYFTPPLVQT